VSFDPSHPDRQRHFYESREHDHLRSRADDYYADRLVARLADAVGMQAQHRVVEIGASFGRFTFPLLRHCQSVVAVDISERALCELAAKRDELGIDPSRCRIQVADARDLTRAEISGAVDFVVGFFILHHLEDICGTMAAMSKLIGAGGGLAFLEPNRRNPLFLMQVLVCPDMTWQEEKGMFTLSARGVCRAYREASLRVDKVLRFGFFPPQLINRFSWARRLEAGVERIRLFEPLLPFLLMTAAPPDEPGDVLVSRTRR